MGRVVIAEKMCKQFVVALFAMLLFRSTHNLNTKPFPSGFLIGTASSSYQVEGAWNESGKGISIWDTFTRTSPQHIYGRSNGNIACDSYHKIQEDVALLKNLGVDHYRFSLSWTRILPTGYANQINHAGIHYYNTLINELLANNIKPMVTIYHWDLPQKLQDIGGWPNALMEQYFEDYARIVFEAFGDRVKLWITINEPRLICLEAYRGNYAPGIESIGIGTYLCAHTILKAHARVYHLYNKDFKKRQKGKVGITVDACWFEAESDEDDDLEAQERQMQFQMGWFANPIFHPNGDYPEVMKIRIAARSMLEGFPKSRLPTFTESRKAMLRNSADFLGLNHYTSFMVDDAKRQNIGPPTYDKDVGVRLWQNASWPQSAGAWFTVVPWGFTKLLKWIKDRYNNPEIYITENGYCGTKELDDIKRIKYHQEYISAMLDAIYNHKVNVKAYTVWSFLDSFEWAAGYKFKFGLHYVDFGSRNRTRTPKLSATVIKEIIENRRLIEIQNETQ